MWIVTGASRGLGRSIVIELLERGHRVIAIVRNIKAKEEMMNAFSRNALLVDVLYADLSRPEEWNCLFNQLEQKCKRGATHLVNNAGVFANKSILDEGYLADVESHVDINLRFPIALTALFVKSLHCGRNPVIMNICSSSSYDGFAGTSLYCATKHGLLGFTRSIQHDLRYQGFKTYSISPGSIDTEMSSILAQDKNTFIRASDVAKKVVDIGTDSSSVYHYEVRFARHQPR